jgi:hypothetical protein
MRELWTLGIDPNLTDENGRGALHVANWFNKARLQIMPQDGGKRHKMAAQPKDSGVLFIGIFLTIYCISHQLWAWDLTNIVLDIGKFGFLLYFLVSCKKNSWPILVT